jgi:hypothetical protein
MLEPRTKLLPAPIVHAGFTSLAALSAADEKGAAIGVEVCLGQVQSLADTKPGPPQSDDQAAYPRAVNAVAGLAHHRHDLLDSRWVGRVAQSLVPGRASGVIARERRR